MSGEAAGAKLGKSRAWQRNATRKAILSVARRIVEQEGLDLLSLNRVAAEAEFAPTTVYAYFPNLNDLLVAIFADDLASMARAMRETYPFPEPAAEPTSAETDGAATDAEPVESESAEEDGGEGKPAHMPAVRKVARLDAAQVGARAERVRAALMKEQGAEEAAPDADKSDAPRVDAWLERRLRVFERTLAELETKVAEAERNSQRAMGVAQDSATAFNQRAEVATLRGAEADNAMSARMSALEKRQRDAVTELRTFLKNTDGRLEKIEAAVLGASRPTTYLPPEEETAAPQEPPPPSGDDTPPPDGDQQPQQPASAEAPEAKDTFLSAARRAAKAAATLASIDDDERGEMQARQTRFLLIGAGALAAVLAGAALVFHLLPQNSAPAFASPALAATETGYGTTRIHPSVAALHGRLAALAAQGNVKAELLMGLESLNGESGGKNDVNAALWLGRAASAGDPVAEYWLGTLYQAGRGVNNDPATAMHWLEAAATQGNRKAMHALAMAYAMGTGVPRDFDEAARWFSRAANLGLVNSQFNLAVLYERGQGLPQSLLDAYKWYAIAAAQGDSEAQARVDALATQLSSDDLAAAKQSAASFKPDPVDAGANFVPRTRDLAGG